MADAPADSILATTKKALGLDADYDAFDVDIIMHVNSVLSTLNQLGVGNPDGFMIEDDSATWPDFLNDDPKLNFVKSYIYTRVRLLFDPPDSPVAITSLENQIKEAEWRINVMVDTVYTDPDDIDTPVIDGGLP